VITPETNVTSVESPRNPAFVDIGRIAGSSHRTSPSRDRLRLANRIKVFPQLDSSRTEERTRTASSGGRMSSAQAPKGRRRRGRAAANPEAACGREVEANRRGRSARLSGHHTLGQSRQCVGLTSTRRPVFASTHTPST
jgi:hypothetical protein